MLTRYSTKSKHFQIIPFLSRKRPKAILFPHSFWKHCKIPFFWYFLDLFKHFSIRNLLICWPIGQQMLNEHSNTSEYHQMILFLSRNHPKSYLSFHSFWKSWKLPFLIVFWSFWAFPNLKYADLLTYRSTSVDQSFRYLQTSYKLSFLQFISSEKS